jgi:hypothetical protein
LFVINYEEAGLIQPISSGKFPAPQKNKPKTPKTPKTPKQQAQQTESKNPEDKPRKHVSTLFRGPAAALSEPRKPFRS